MRVGDLFRSDGFRVGDVTDTTKRIALDLAGLTTGTTRTLTIPDLSGTLALLSASNVWSAHNVFSAALRYGSASRTASFTMNGVISAVQLCDASAGAFTATLGTTTVGATIRYVKTDTSANVITLAGTFADGTSSLLLSHPGQIIDLFAVTTTTYRVVGNTHPLYTHFIPRQVNAAVAGAGVETSAIGTGNGFGSMTLPAGWWYRGRRVKVTCKGTYQPPLNPGAVTVRIRVGGVTAASVTVAASVFATSQTTAMLEGEVVLVCDSISGNNALLRAEGRMDFETSTLGLPSVQPLSTARNGGSPTATVTVANNAAMLVDVTEEWSNNQTQGTWITHARMSEAL